MLASEEDCVSGCRLNIMFMRRKVFEEEINFSCFHITIFDSTFYMEIKRYTNLGSR
jgi:hypothetical protein